MKSLTALWKVVADDLATICHTSAALDYKTVERRVEHEGDQFLTITLPEFSKSFEKALDSGLVDSSYFAGFSRGKGPLPRFLGGFLSQVFNTASGELLTSPSIDCIFAIRQLTLIFGKISRPCDEARVRSAINGYVECEEEVEKISRSISDASRNDLRRMASFLFADVLSTLEAGLLRGEYVGRHGPGATSDRLRGNAKYDLTEWPLRLEKWFPYGEQLLPNWRYHYRHDRVNFLEPEQERPVRVITVPKTLKAPRIIAIEPAAMQYAQQAILQPLVELLESHNISSKGHVAKNHCVGLVGFTDQEPNRDLARKGSSDGSLATLDLSEASDRVSTVHVEDLLWRWPHLREAVFDTRSTKAQVPGHGVLNLTKFASMGSALCFPMEAMVFLAVVMLGVEDAVRANELQELKPTVSMHGILHSMQQRVRVYGDDLIVPVNAVYYVMSRLESFGFKVNKTKSFWNGKFRESCGGDYFDGEWVTPIRLRHDLPSSRRDAQEMVSLVSFRNQLYYAGLWGACGKLDKVISRHFGGHFPITESSSPLLGRHSFLSSHGERMCRDTHTPLVRAWVAASKPPTSLVSGEGALMKCLAPSRGKPFEDALHLERQGRPEAVRLKLRWQTPYSYGVEA